MDLLDVDHIDQAEYSAPSSICAPASSVGFANGAFGGGFIRLHEAGRQGPEPKRGSIARLHSRTLIAILVPDGRSRRPAADSGNGSMRIGPDVARAVVAVGNRERERMGTFGAEFHMDAEESDR